MEHPFLTFAPEAVWKFWKEETSLAPTGISKPRVTNLPPAQTLRKVNHSAHTLYSNFCTIFRVDKHYFPKQHEQIRPYNGYKVFGARRKRNCYMQSGNLSQ